MAEQSLSMVGAIIGVVAGLFVVLPIYLHSRLMDRLEHHIDRLQREINSEDRPNG